MRAGAASFPLPHAAGTEVVEIHFPLLLFLNVALCSENGRTCPAENRAGRLFIRSSSPRTESFVSPSANPQSLKDLRTRRDALLQNRWYCWQVTTLCVETSPLHGPEGNFPTVTGHARDDSLEDHRTCTRATSGLRMHSSRHTEGTPAVPDTRSRRSSPTALICKNYDGNSPGTVRKGFL